MKKYLELLKTVALFKNINDKELEAMLKCLGAHEQQYLKNDIILLFDSEVLSVGIVLSGSAQIVKEDIMGNRTLLLKLTEGDMFGETFACANISKSPVTVLTTTGCEVLFIQIKKITAICSSVCAFHTKIIENMLQLIAQKNIILNCRLDILSCRSTREKLMAYFSLQIQEYGKGQFKIPFSRDELADYLCVNRSALSRELCNMRNENILSFNKNEFEIYALLI